MKIVDVLIPNAIKVNLNSNTKSDAIRELSNLLSSAVQADDESLDFDGVVQSILDREKLSSTGLTNGLAIPHAKVKGISKIMAAIGLSKEGIDFDSMDKLKSKIFFILISPKEDSGNHVKILAQITRVLKEDKARSELLACETEEQVLEFIKNKET